MGGGVWCWSEAIVRPNYRYATYLRMVFVDSRPTRWPSNPRNQQNDIPLGFLHPHQSHPGPAPHLSPSPGLESPARCKKQTAKAKSCSHSALPPRYTFCRLVTSSSSLQGGGLVQFMRFGSFTRGIGHSVLFVYLTYPGDMGQRKGGAKPPVQTEYLLACG